MPDLPAALKSATDFYDYLGVADPERLFLQKHAAYRYKLVKIPKRRGGSRSLLVPEPRLKFLQRRTLELLEQLYVPRRPVHGFVKSRSAITNANAHQGRPYLLNLDLANYFETIRRRRVLGMLKAVGVPHDVADAICCICVTRDHLPQGSPASPILANLVTYRLDRGLMNFAKSHRLRYTRYADDISFSSYVPPAGLFADGHSSDGKLAVDALAKELRQAFQANDFEINPDKLWFSGPRARKEVTGLVVGEFTNIKRTFVRNLRASLYKVEQLGRAGAEADLAGKHAAPVKLDRVLRGRLEWLAQVRGRSFPPFRSLAKRFNRLFPDTLPIQIDPTYEEIVESAVWIVEFFFDDDKGEAQCDQGTAFFLEGVGLVTCFHTVESLPKGAKASLHRPSLPGKAFEVEPTKHACPVRDLVVLSHNVPEESYRSLSAGSGLERPPERIIAYGFPAFGPGDGLSRRPGEMIGRTTKSGVKLLDVSAILESGISGGPVVNQRNEVVGIAVRGGGMEPKQLAVEVPELIKLLAETP